MNEALAKSWTPPKRRRLDRKPPIMPVREAPAPQLSPRQRTCQQLSEYLDNHQGKVINALPLADHEQALIDIPSVRAAEIVTDLERLGFAPRFISAARQPVTNAGIELVRGDGHNNFHQRRIPGLVSMSRYQIHLPKDA